jgi:hypothetical protein
MAVAAMRMRVAVRAALVCLRSAMAMVVMGMPVGVITAVVPVPVVIVIMMMVVTIGRSPVERDSRPAIAVPVWDATAVTEKPTGAAIPIGLGGARDRHHAETGEQRKRKAKLTSHD